MHAILPPSDLIRLAREAKGLTQTEFAAELGKSQGQISRYESGRVDPPASVCMHCMHILRPALPVTPAFGAALETVRTTLDVLMRAVQQLQQAAVASDDTLAAHAPDSGHAATGEAQ